MNMFEVWLLLVFLPKLPFMLVPILVSSALISIISAGWWIVSWEEWKNDETIVDWKETGWWEESDQRKQTSAENGLRSSIKAFKFALAGMITSGLLLASVPNKKEIAAIVLIPYISNNPEFKQLPENMIGMLNDLIKEYRQELGKK